MKTQKTLRISYIINFMLISGMLLFASSCQQSDHDAVAAQNETVAKQFLEAYNEQDLSLMKKNLADPFLINGEEMELQTFNNILEGFWSAFPDTYLNASHIVGTHNYTTVRFLQTGTGKGEFFGYDIDKKEVNYSEIILFVLDDGLITEYWYAWDELDFWTQLGVIESPYPGDE